MGLLLSFSPFAAFVAFERFFGTTPGLLAGALTALLLLVRERLLGHREVKLLEAGAAVLFGGLAIWAAVFGADHWSVAGVRLRVDTGLLLIVVASIALRRPFTLQYAKARVGAEVAASAAFLKLNMILTAAWVLALLVLVLADVLLIVKPEAPVWVAVAISGATLAAAMKFTTWYPRRAILGALNAS